MLDYLETLPMEIEAVWPNLRHPTGIAIIYLLNRYLFGLSSILNLLTIIPGSTTNTTYVFNADW